MDLPKIARYLAQVVAGWLDFELVPLSANDIDVVIILCGCPRACGNKEEVRARAKHSLLIAGESLGGIPVSAANLPRAVEGKLIELLNILTVTR